MSINSWGSELDGGGRLNKNAIHGLQKRVENGELHKAITTHGSKLVGGGHMNENAMHGTPKKD